MFVIVNGLYRLNVRESTCESVCLGANMHVNVGVRKWSWLNVRESACESVCVGANTHVNVGVCEWIWLNVCESTSESVSLGELYTCECGCA